MNKPKFILKQNTIYLDKKDDKKRIDKNNKVKNNTGINPEELWNLDYTIACFILPRLKSFKKSKAGHPACYTEKEWDKKLDHMIKAFQLLSKENVYYTEKADELIEKGLKLFIEDYRRLWS